jgi:uncharacterized membrane protein AbrB (regulator of aidB expression)
MDTMILLYSEMRLNVSLIAMMHTLRQILTVLIIPVVIHQTTEKASPRYRHSHNNFIRMKLSVCAIFCFTNKNMYSIFF